MLGPQAQVLPEIRLTRVEAGDVIAVCSDGLYRYVDGEELGRWLSSRDGLMDILVDLLTATADRGGDEDTSLCLCRVRRLPEERLPEPAPRADKTVAAPPELPHFTVPRTSRVGPTRVLFALATIAVGVGAIGGGLGWWSGVGTGEDLRAGWVNTDSPAVAPPPPVQPARDTQPTAAQAPVQDVINDLIVECVKVVGCSALSITHDMASARKIANRIAMLYQGRIMWAGPADQIDRSGNEYVDQFIHGRAEGPIQMQVRAL